MVHEEISSEKEKNQVKKEKSQSYIEKKKKCHLDRINAVVTCRNAVSMFVAVFADVSRNGIPKLSA